MRLQKALLYTLEISARAEIRKCTDNFQGKPTIRNTLADFRTVLEEISGVRCCRVTMSHISFVRCGGLLIPACPQT